MFLLLCASISYNFDASYFNFYVICFVLSTGNKILANSLLVAFTGIRLEGVWLSKLFDSHKFTKCSSYDSFILSNIQIPPVAVQFYSCILVGKTSIHVSCYLVSTTKSEFCHQLYPAYKSCSSVFNTQWVLTHPSQRDLLVQTHAWQYRFLLVCFYYLFFHWLYILNIRALALDC